MTRDIRNPKVTALRQTLWNLALIIVGSSICAMAINGILIPMQFVSGGVTGLTLIVYNQFPSLNFGLLYFAFNIPLYLLAYMSVGRRFFFYSLAGLLIFTTAVNTVHVPIPIHDKILGALLAGIIIGTGTGVTLRSLGSTGGTDILSIMLLKRFSIKIGNTILALNCMVLLLVGYLFSLEAVLYTVIYLYVSAKIINLVVTGLSQRKAVFIISSKWREISGEILSDIKRGVTVIQGEGGYSGQKEQILYTVITFRELSQVKRLIQKLDPNAFVVVSDTLEVINYRIGNQPHW